MNQAKTDEKIREGLERIDRLIKELKQVFKSGFEELKTPKGLKVFKN
jgi:hypothetical protein